MDEYTESSGASDSGVVKYHIEDPSQYSDEDDTDTEDVVMTGCTTASSSPGVPTTIGATTTIAHRLSASSGNTIAAYIPLTEFTYFPKLPYELRHMIFKIAIRDSDPRILAIQPQYRQNPALTQVCSQSREACAKYYHYCASRQRIKNFRFFIDYEKDVLYLNVPFTLRGGKAELSVLQATHSIYPEFLELISNLAMNLKEVHNLSGPHRGQYTLWSMLEEWCPNLKEVKVVVNNFPANGLILNFIEVKTPEQVKKMVSPTLVRRVERVSESFKKAKKEKGQCSKFRLRLVFVDETARKVLTKKERGKTAEIWRKENPKKRGEAASRESNLALTDRWKDKRGFMKAKVVFQEMREMTEIKKAPEGKIPKKPVDVVKKKAKYKGKGSGRFKM
ncbi:hypothetical protein VTL71DRAFT_508 [Oculimacula yallundae]|uniref:2EXR domain-containing protein n=1 Tax=Oculimacula yallundae TaxID=86028 RepID=A0ABR4D088_9HELO